MIYLLDADTLITGDRKYYPIKRFPVFWDWLHHKGTDGVIKIPLEQYEEIIAGRREDDLVSWLRDGANKAALVLDENADPALVAMVTARGYAPDLNEVEQVELGRDPFLIAYGFAVADNRTIVTFENSSPGKNRARRKVPDVCATMGVACVTLFEVIDVLDFTTNWKP